ncbi:MAG: flagellar basal body rod C-terminal domain-containing protein [Acidimicrobiales bacterium]
MSGLFGSLGVAYSGMDTYKTWIDATADNVANVNTVRKTSETAFQAKYVVAQSVPGSRGGVRAGIGQGTSVADIALSSGNGVVVYDPSSPLADAQGMVRRPDVDMSEQMTNLIIAQRAYQANVTVFERARDAYTQALQIGK